MECLALNETSISHSHPTKAQGGGGIQIVESRCWKECYRAVPSRYDRGTILLNSQLLWLPTQDLQEIKPDHILSWTEEGLTRPHL